MSFTNIVAKQYRDKVAATQQYLAAYAASTSASVPTEGWVRTVRQALGMSATELASRLGVTKARIHRAERDETTGSVTLKTMVSYANALDSDFVYAIVPRKPIEQAIKDRAVVLAKQRVRNAAIHMALEDQSLTEEQLNYEIERVANEILEKMPRKFWSN